jgi:3-oxoadipate enol-lactonase
MPKIEAGDGAILHVEVSGKDKGPVVMFSNSLGTNLHMWDGQMPAFEKKFRVVRYDSRGHGKSAAPEGPYSIDRLGQDALAIMDRLKLDRVHWVGLSKGGMVGQWLATHAPERIGRLVLCNTASQMPTPALWNTRIRTCLDQGMPALVDTILMRWFSEKFRKSGSPEIDRVKAMVLSTPEQGYAACSGAIRDMDQREAIRAVTAPTLIVAGKVDPATTPAAARLIQSRIRGSKLVQLNAAHLSNIEQPEAFTAAVMGFLTGKAA